jgi:indoleamine 2,3-dioxygenase
MPITHEHKHLHKTQAQSAIIPAFDAFLGVAHEMDSMREYLLEMRRYMPQPHVAFIERLEALAPSVRAVVLEAAEAEEGSAAVVDAYDNAVAALARFR